MLRRKFLLSKILPVYSVVEVEARTEKGLYEAVSKFLDEHNASPTVTSGLEWALMPPPGWTGWRGEKRELMSFTEGEVWRISLTNSHHSDTEGTEDKTRQHTVRKHTRTVGDKVYKIKAHKRGKS